MRSTTQFLLLLSLFGYSSFIWGHRPLSVGEESLEYVLPTGNEYRLASGAPGPKYWQQQVDYVIEAEIDDARTYLSGKEQITYHNHSPHGLSYLWMQLDQNVFSKNSERNQVWSGFDFDQKTSTTRDDITFKNLRSFYSKEIFDGGIKKLLIQDVDGNPLSHTVVGTNVRIDLKTPLLAGEAFVFNVEWAYPIPGEGLSFRNGFSVLEDGNKVYQMGQWYPRMCAYYDTMGWQNNPYMGYGEFALEFGNFDVSIKVPKDFVVAATGALENKEQVLSSEILKRLELAIGATEPIEIITEDEAADARRHKSTFRKKVWRFQAKNVRDFAFSCSRAYIWDAKGISIDGETVMAMSVYPQEAAGLWKRYSTESIAATLKGYSAHVLPYPYPVAWSTWGPIYGMEYPMISFQSSFDIEENRSYSLKARNYLIGVVIHEVGHNWFPMIINSDEREWAFMDEGLNTFVESLVAPRFDRLLAEKQIEENRRVIEKMVGQEDDPIVVTAEVQTDRGFQAYRKPTVAFTVLREAVMGRELFDFALQEFARRWAFKRPTPADLFRTFEDASGMDLEWFWKGWFFGTDFVDLSIASVESFRLESWDPDKRADEQLIQKNQVHRSSWEQFVHDQPGTTDEHDHLLDWYLKNDPLEVTKLDRENHDKIVGSLKSWQREMIDVETIIHVVKVENLGGLISPFSLDVHYENGSVETLSIPASIWRKGTRTVEIPLRRGLKIEKVVMDKFRSTADADYSNNIYPREISMEYFRLNPDKENPNPMNKATNKDLWNASKKANIEK